MPTYSITTPDMMSPDTPGLHLSKFEKRLKIPHPMALAGMSPEQIKREVLQTHRGQSAPPNQPDMASLVASGQLQNAIKFYTKVHKTGAAGRKSNNYATV